MASDFKKVDAYVDGPADYDEIPELTDEFFTRAESKIGGKSIRQSPSQPASVEAEQQVTLQLDPGIVDGFRATGTGWELRINDVLRAWLAQRAA